MKNIFKILTVVVVISISSCFKDPQGLSDTFTQRLTQLQHDWRFVSRTTLSNHYVGTIDDHYNFDISSLVYRHVSGVTDTAVYQLIPDGVNLLISPVKNGMRVDTTIDYLIYKISDTLLIIGGGTGPTATFTDSLRR